MTKKEREMDLTIAELEHEHRLMSTRNKRLERELEAAAVERDKFKIALERILAVSSVAVRDSRSERVTEMGPTKQISHPED